MWIFCARVAWACEVIFFPRGQIKTTFSWSMVIASNNQVEAYALFKGLSLAKRLGIKDISIIGDSGVILNQIRKRSPPQDMKLKSIIVRALGESEAFQSLQCFHLLRINNARADSFVNLAIRDFPGTLRINGQATHHYIP